MHRLIFQNAYAFSHRLIFQNELSKIVKLSFSILALFGGGGGGA